MLISSRYLHKKRLAPDAARKRWFVKQAKRWAVEPRTSACTHAPARRRSAAGLSRDEWFRNQRLSPLLILACPRRAVQARQARRASRVRVAPHDSSDRSSRAFLVRAAGFGDALAARMSVRPLTCKARCEPYGARAAANRRKRVLYQSTRTLFSSNWRYLLIWIVVKLQFSVKKNFIGLQPSDF